LRQTGNEASKIRSANENILPAFFSSAAAEPKVLPALKGKAPAERFKAAAS